MGLSTPSSYSAIHHINTRYPSHFTQTIELTGPLFPPFQGIGYPNTYATAEQADKDPAAYRLNCAQRAHANFTENLTPWLAAVLIAGLRYPVPAAGLGFGWLASRVVYTVGYTSDKGPKGRIAYVFLLSFFPHSLVLLELVLTMSSIKRLGWELPDLVAPAGHGWVHGLLAGGG